MNQAVRKEPFRLCALGAKLHSVLRGHAHDIVVVKNIPDMTHRGVKWEDLCAGTNRRTQKFVYISIFQVFVPRHSQSAEISILGSMDVYTPSVFTSRIGLARTHVRAHLSHVP